MRRLEQLLVDGPAGITVQLEADVTAGGEKATDLFDSIEQGQRQVGYMASSYLSARVPALGVLDLPFSVADRSLALAALDGRAGALLREAVAQGSDFHVLGYWDNGFRHISNALRPIRTPADCVGQAIRTLNSAHYRALLGALGFTPVSLDVKDFVHAVQTGAVQAQENPLTNFIGFGLWQHHPHLSLTAHGFGVLLLVCRRAWYQGLTAPQREQLDGAVSETTALQRQLACEQDHAALAQLQAHGVQVLGPEMIDLTAMRAAAARFSAGLRQQVPAALLAAYLPTVAA